MVAFHLAFYQLAAHGQLVQRLLNIFHVRLFVVALCVHTYMCTTNLSYIIAMQLYVNLVVALSTSGSYYQ